jgi:hypothetical protein
MTALVRLYPRAWRDRYEDEFLDLLEARPPGFLDRLDILLGALDARLHPEVPGSRDPSAPDRTPVTDPRRLGGLLLVIGGLAWVGAGIAFVTSPFTDGNRDAALGATIAMLGTVLIGLGATLGSAALGRHARAGRLLGLAIAGAGLLFILPWPILAIGVFSSWILTVVFGLYLADAGDRIGILLVIAGLVVMALNVENAQALLAVPYGLAWMAVGAGLVAGRQAPSRSTATAGTPGSDVGR